MTEAGDGSPPVRDLSYTAASRELDDIVRFFEQREIDVDQLVGRLERATAIVDELDRRLRRTRTQVEELVPRLAAVLSGDGADDPGDRAVEDELDRADELVEAIDEAIDDEISDDEIDAGEVVGVGGFDEPVLDVGSSGDGGDPGPVEPPGLF